MNRSPLLRATAGVTKGECDFNSIADIRHTYLLNKSKQEVHYMAARAIWRKAINADTLLSVNARYGKTLMGVTGISITKIGDNFVEGTMPVDDRTRQPYGLLHGGASAALAETLGSLASGFVAGESHSVVGVELSASHLRGVKDGSVTGRASPIRLGKGMHVWEIKIHETGKEEAGLVCHSKLTVAVRENKVHPPPAVKY
jgi:1,4-dihydroxy-2-naphthoyl-CoA hydrolase